MKTKRLQEYDVVELCKALPGIDVPIGTRGTILIVYDSALPEYEVEFVEPTGDTLALLTVKEGYLQKINLL